MDWTKALKNLKKDKKLALLIKKHGACTIKPSPKKDYFVDLVSSIVGQQLSVKAASTIFKRLKTGLGGVDPKKILNTKDSDFREWGLSRQKTLYIKDLAKKVEEGSLEISEFTKLSDQEVVNRLTMVKGIGKWTADMFLMFSLARPDIFPVEDLGIRTGMRKLYHKDMTREEMEEKAKNWIPYRTPASWYIWRSLENT